MRLTKSSILLGLGLSALVLFQVHNITSASTTALGSLAASMQPGTWAELSTNNINPTLTNTGGSTGMTLPYSDTAVWDPLSQRLLFVGGDHAPDPCYPRFVAYSESTNAWQTLTKPSWFPCTPAWAMHGYNHTAIDAAKGKLYHRPFNDAVVRKYDLASQAWTALPPVTSSVIGYISVAVGVTWFPERNSLVYASIESGTNGAVAEYSETTGQWKRIAGNLPMGGYHNFAKYDPIHKIVLFGGGDSDRHMYKLDSTGQVTTLKNAPIPVGVHETVMTVDPISGKLLVFGNSKSFYVYDPATDTWQLQSGGSVPLFTGAVFDPPVSGIVASPVSSHGVSMFTRCSTDKCQVYLYKHSSGQSAPPAVTDTAAPAVSVSSPAAGAVISGTITISATASDNVGVSGVQFKLDGNNLGGQDTTSPYSASWNTTTATNGAHTLTATATDAAGNQTTSSAVSVTVNNAPAPTSGSSDFTARCAAAGVVKCVGFDQAADIAGGYGSNSGIYSGATTPQLDPAVAASGSSLKFTIPSNSAADTSGSYFTNFSPDLSVQFGQGQEFYVQWRQRFSPEFLNTYYQGGGGWKQSIIGEGDRPGETVVNSCTQLEIVTQNTYQRGFAQNYHSCGGKDQNYEPLSESFGAYDFKLQNNQPAPYCLYSQSNSSYFPPVGNCVGYFPNEWMTFQMHIKVGTWYLNDKNYHRDSTVELWIAREGQPSQKVSSFTGYDIANNNPAAKYGKVWLLPYHTGKSSAQSHPTGYTWYDELIISRTKIADPGSAASTTPPPPTDTAPATAAPPTAAPPTTAPSSSPPPSGGGLIGYWKFDDGTGASASDSSGSNNHGTLTNTPAWTTGKVNGALQFDASDNGNDNDDSRVVVGRTFDIPSVPFTLAAWVNPTDFADYRAILSKRDSPNLDDMRLDWGLNRTSGTVYLYQAGAALTASYAPARNAWTHLAVVAGSTNTKLYVNGVLQETLGVMSLGRDAAANTVIGGTGEGAGGDNDPFKGKIDEVRVYNRDLSASEIQNLSTSSATSSVSTPAPPPAIEPTATFSIPSQGGDAWMTTGTSGSISTGYARIQQDTGASALSGLAIFGYRPAGVLVTEAAVPASVPVSGGRIYVDVNGPVNTGIAFANANSDAAVISFYFTDTAGTDFAQGSFTLNGNQQMSAFLNQAPFNGRSSMRGTFTFSSSVPVGVIAIRGFANERSEFLITTLPVSPIGDTNTNTIVLPHFADGQGWTTQIILTNPTNSAASGQVQFYGPGIASQSAPLLNLSINGASNSVFSYAIPPRSAVRLATGGGSQPTQVGSVRITPTAGMAPTATSIFSFMVNGVTVSEAGVSALPAGLVFRMYAEASGVSFQTGSIESGVAIVNPSQSPVTVSLEVTRMDGSSPVPPVTVTVPANGQIARFIRELFANLPVPFYGFFKATAPTPVGVTGLRGRYNERGDFLITTTPPRNEDQMPAAASQLIFPHIVSGGGYTTQFTIFGQSSSGRLWFNSQNGTVLGTTSLRRVQ